MGRYVLCPENGPRARSYQVLGLRMRHCERFPSDRDSISPVSTTQSNSSLAALVILSVTFRVR
jgi:hypothetical protein